ncbi:hypothetical protein EV643_11581 [Kribbella sp. VKM Ac-2527]|uniref:Uncharacterized protein n=1 Tax=Kribbella caucasensis TaxID=2512215 RepID=A0A4V3C999_9ACTN|nr:hypothetical protein [Kribbella sp. VKM Ac-2527]TDO44581.1 hypothetical protein EV643_11581 [Kribbella sp. VKM Ac-2527]
MSTIVMPRGTAEWVGVIARGCSLAAGGALLVGAILVVFRDEGSVSTTALIVGAILLVLPAVVDRLTGFSVTPEGFDFQFTQQVADLGAPKTAALLDETGIARDLETYAYIYGELTGPELLETRKRLLDKLVAQATALATARKFDPAEVQRMFVDGSPVMRVLALGLMEGDSALVSADVLRSAIVDSRTGNEQYHGLKLAERAWPRLSTENRAELIELITRDRHIPTDRDRLRLAQRIMNLQEGHYESACGPT